MTQEVDALPQLPGYVIVGYGKGVGTKFFGKYDFAFDGGVEGYAGAVNGMPYLQLAVHGTVYLPRG